MIARVRARARAKASSASLEFATTLLGLNLLCFALSAFHLVHAADASKRGCSAFGHSCFGGHGKRSDPDALQVGAGAAAAIADMLDDQTARESERDRDWMRESERDKELALLAGLTAASSRRDAREPREPSAGQGPGPAPPLDDRAARKAYLDCQAIKQICLKQAALLGKMKRLAEVSSSSLGNELGGL